jgi:hypothetical protein
MNTKQLLETTRALGAQFSTKRKNAQNVAKLSNMQWWMHNQIRVKSLPNDQKCNEKVFNQAATHNSTLKSSRMMIIKQMFDLKL